MHRTTLSVLALWLTLIPVATMASPLATGAPRLANSALDEMRGGFLTDGGMRVSLNFEGTVWINGVERAYNALTIRNIDFYRLREGFDLNWASHVDENLPQDLSIVTSQNLDGGPTTVVQNGLDGQTIQYGNNLGIQVSGMEGYGPQGTRAILTPTIIQSLY